MPLLRKPDLAWWTCLVIFCISGCLESPDVQKPGGDEVGVEHSASFSLLDGLFQLTLPSAQGQGFIAELGYDFVVPAEQPGVSNPSWSGGCLAMEGGDIHKLAVFARPSGLDATIRTDDEVHVSSGDSNQINVHGQLANYSRRSLEEPTTVFVAVGFESPVTPNVTLRIRSDSIDGIDIQRVGDAKCFAAAHTQVRGGAGVFAGGSGLIQDGELRIAEGPWMGWISWAQTEQATVELFQGDSVWLDSEDLEQEPVDSNGLHSGFFRANEPDVYLMRLQGSFSQYKPLGLGFMDAFVCEFAVGGR